jgi:polyisoprenyl-phosphate glycosyltransferase
MSTVEMLSIIVPLYKSELNLPKLFLELERISVLSPVPLELVFVDDGSPDQCGAIVHNRIRELSVCAQLVQLSRNFGAFAAISAGLKAARGSYFAVLAADLQEPPELSLQFLEQLRTGKADVVFGVREDRDDPFVSGLIARLFWILYRWLVNPEIPPGGVDIFGCNRKVRDQLCSMKEVETSLVALLFWIGYRRGYVAYKRRRRQEGHSAWTLSKKLRYLINSVFNFTDLPIRILLGTGCLGMGLATAGACMVLLAKEGGRISVPGYAATVLTVLFFGGLTAIGLGIVGQYQWLCLQNARNRPAFIIDSSVQNDIGEPQIGKLREASVQRIEPK